MLSFSRGCLWRALFLATLWVTCGSAPEAYAQQDTSAVSTEQAGVTLTLGGTLQPRFTYGHLDLGRNEAGGSEGVGVLGNGDPRERVGFGVRRARLRVEALLSRRAGAYFQLGAADPATQLFDAVLFFDVTDALRLRMGRFTSAQPRAFQGTSHTRIDLVDRVAVAQRWGNTTLANDGRDFGLDVLYETDRFDVQAGLYNGFGGWSRAFGNLRTDIAEDPTGGTDTPGLAPSIYGAWRPAAWPGVEAGAFAGYNGARSRVTQPPEALAPENADEDVLDRGRAYASYSGHLYWGSRPGSQPVRLKADLLSTRFETLALDAGSTLEQHALGASLLGAVGFFDQSAELLARVERYDSALAHEGNAEDYLGVGASLSLSALRGRPYLRQRLTFAYSSRLSDDNEPHLFVLQAQVVF